MATQYNRNDKSISVVAWSPFNRTTGAASNIDDIIAATNGHINYSGGNLIVGNVARAALDKVGSDIDTDEVVALTPTEVTAGWTED